jgi:murein DD-endopeptidase MepM/ murein hydrolase activator NlpD
VVRRGGLTRPDGRRYVPVDDSDGLAHHFGRFHHGVDLAAGFETQTVGRPARNDGRDGLPAVEFDDDFGY